MVVLVVRERPDGCSVKSKRFHRTNMLSYEIVSGGQRTLLIRVYLPPSTLDNIPDIEEALN